MNSITLDTAMREAVRFLRAADLLKARVADRYSLSESSRQSAALRRASLDLTRALADLRKPG